MASMKARSAVFAATSANSGSAARGKGGGIRYVSFLSGPSGTVVEGANGGGTFSM